MLTFFALAVFAIQRGLLGKQSFTTVSGKGDAGIAMPLPTGVRRVVHSIALPWMAFTLIVYLFALFAVLFLSSLQGALFGGLNLVLRGRAGPEHESEKPETSSTNTARSWACSRSKTSSKNSSGNSRHREVRRFP